MDAVAGYDTVAVQADESTYPGAGFAHPTPVETAGEPTLEPGTAAPEDSITELDGPETSTPGEPDTGPGQPGPGPGQPDPPEVPVPPTGWNLVWSDEFNGSAVDSSLWTVLDNSTYGAGNDEVACLLNRPENVKVTGGTLKLTARREATPIACEGGTTRPYTSGHLNTKGKVSFTYGRFEVRAKVPTAPGRSKGLWPAFWMRPVTGGLGEIDIMEQVGTASAEIDQSGWVSQTLWYDYVGTHPKENFVHKSPFSLDQDFHTYAVEWEPGEIRWYVNGVESYRLSSADVSWMAGTFDQPFYLRLNLAVGGRWPGNPTAETRLPATYEIDYVRVYQH